MMEDHGAPSVRSRFCAASSTYDRHADVQISAAGGLLELLSPLPAPERILEIGCGTGQLTSRLLERFPEARLDAVDISPGMIRVARERLDASGRVRWIVDDARSLAPSEPYPLIVANCSLHWLHPLEDALAHVAGLLASGGHLAATVMLEGTLLELHAARRAAAPEKVPSANLPAGERLRAGLDAAHLEVESLVEEEVQSISPSVEHLLDQLRRQGLTGGSISRATIPLNRGDIRRMIEHYVASHRVPGGVQVTYRVGRFLATRPA